MSPDIFKMQTTTGFYELAEESSQASDESCIDEYGTADETTGSNKDAYGNNASVHDQDDSGPASDDDRSDDEATEGEDMAIDAASVHDQDDSADMVVNIAKKRKREMTEEEYSKTLRARMGIPFKWSDTKKRACSADMRKGVREAVGHACENTRSHCVKRNIWIPMVKSRFFYDCFLI